MKNTPLILDCTLRDGGYYTNWYYRHDLVTDYLEFSKKIGINFIEIGFRSKKNSNLGQFAFCENKFLDKFSHHKNIVLMTDLKEINKLNTDKDLEKLFTFNKFQPKFIRIAMLKNQLSFLEKKIHIFKKSNLNFCINLMQISICKMVELKKFIMKLEKMKLNKIFYFADTFGALQPEDVKKICKVIKDYSEFDIGIHAHDNMGNAIDNTLVAYDEGAKYLDSTIMGMGRGAGNSQTESLYHYLNPKNLYSEKLFTSLIYKHFYKLKKKYMWGQNYLYFLAAKKNIHPSFIQKINEKDLNDNLLFNLLENSKNNTYQAYSIDKGKELIKNFNNKKNVISDIKRKKKILCLINNASLKNNKIKLVKFIKKYNPIICSLNYTKLFNDKIDYHFVINRARLSRDLGRLINFKKDIVSTDEMAIEYRNIVKIKTFNRKKSDNLLGFFLEFCKRFKLTEVYFAGLDGFKDKNDRRNIANQKILNKFKSLKITFLTKSNYKFN